MANLLSPHFFFMQRFTPISPTKSVMRYEVYRNKYSSDEDFNTISDMYKRIMSEDKYLCVNTQKNMNVGVFVNGLLHPEMEKGPLHFQSTVRDVVKAHRQKEEAAGHEIWPADERISKNITSQDSIPVPPALEVYGGEDDLKQTLNSNLAPAIAV